jgi:hypothetical protein
VRPFLVDMAILRWGYKSVIVVMIGETMNKREKIWMLGLAAGQANSSPGRHVRGSFTGGQHRQQSGNINSLSNGGRASGHLVCQRRGLRLELLELYEIFRVLYRHYH